MDNKIWDSILKEMGKMMLIGMVLIVTSAAAVGQDRMATAEERSMVFNGVPITQDADNSAVLNKIITITVQDVSLLEAVEKIAGKAHLEMVYNSKLLAEKNRPVTTSLEQVTVEKALWAVLEGTGLRFAVSADKQLVLLKRKEVANFPERALVATQETITGTVTDAQSGETLPGVNILVKGTSTGASTDQNGNFELTVESLQDTLVVTYIGYQRQEVPIDERMQIDIQLTPEAIMGEEMVVVGYGTAERQDLTGSIASVALEQSRLQPNINPVQSLRGTVSGVNIVDNGRPGSDPSIIIRGQNSITASNEPLIVLDGIIYGGELNDINPNDIESIDILKDASSTAIYGSQAANGVIQITTKEGTTSDPRITVNSYFGYSDFAHLPNLLNAEEYLEVRKDAEEADDGSLPFSPLEQKNIEEGNTIDPFEEIKQTAPVLSNELSVSGRVNKVNYYLSGAYSSQKSPVRGDNFKRGTARINLDIEAASWLNIGTNSGYSTKDRSGIRANLGHTTYLSPYADLYYDDGVPRPLPMDIGLVDNPLQATIRNDNSDLEEVLFTNMYAEVQLPLEGMSYQLTVGYTQEKAEIFNFTPSFDREQFFNLGSGSRAYYKSQDLTIENILKYNHTFANDHRINLTLLYGGYNSQDEDSFLSSNNIFNDALSYNNLTIGENYDISTSASEEQLVSTMARLGYYYKGRYMVDFTIRRDGYSAFGPDQKYGIFPAVGLSWNISEERFIQEIEEINNLKFRASWGKNGNQAVDRYSALSNVTETQYVFSDGGAPSLGLRTTSLANPDLGWETTTSTNLGLDFGLFSDRISGTIDFYLTNTSDLLLSQSIPRVTGYDSFLRNIGKTENKGFELYLQTVNIENAEFRWTTNATFSLNRNKIVQLSGKDADGDGVEDDDIASGWFIGHPLGANFDYVFDGIYQEGGDFSLMPNADPGDIRFKDINGDGAITPDDREVLHSNQPDFTAGITNTFSYRGVSVMTMFNIRKGGYSPNPKTNPGSNYYYYANIFDVLYWTPDNPLNTRPAINYPNPLGYGFYESRSFVRLQDVSLSYNLPTSVVEKINVRNLEIYISGKNLITWTDWKGWDPEYGNDGGGIHSGISPGSNGPLLKTYTVGINIQI